MPRVLGHSRLILGMVFSGVGIKVAQPGMFGMRCFPVIWAIKYFLGDQTREFLGTKAPLSSSEYHPLWYEYLFKRSIIPLIADFGRALLDLSQLCISDF